MTPIITDGLTKHYGPRVGVGHLSLEIPAGSVFGFIGPNGAGKTTTIRLLVGLLRPTAGRAEVLGRPCWRQRSELRRRIGYVPGDLRLPPWIDTEEGLALQSGAHRRDVRRHGLELARELELDPRVPVRRMSRGMRQKLGLILALAHRPDVLILDEPTSGLDPITRDVLKSWLRERGDEGATVFFSSHVLSEVEDLCDRVGIVRAGRLILDESLSSLRRRAKRIVTIRWKGSPPKELPSFLAAEPGEPLSPESWRCRLEGTAPELLEWLHGRPVADLLLGPPQLDALFRSFYDGDGEDR